MIEFLYETFQYNIMSLNEKKIPVTNNQLFMIVVLFLAIPIFYKFLTNNTIYGIYSNYAKTGHTFMFGSTKSLINTVIGIGTGICFSPVFNRMIELNNMNNIIYSHSFTTKLIFIGIIYPIYQLIRFYIDNKTSFFYSGYFSNSLEFLISLIIGYFIGFYASFKLDYKDKEYEHEITNASKYLFIIFNITYLITAMYFSIKNKCAKTIIPTIAKS
tara:strand:- start:14 stop:658 length:645 start_codon:yes stop_codon:yes gene_type:complete